MGQDLTGRGDHQTTHHPAQPRSFQLLLWVTVFLMLLVGPFQLLTESFPFSIPGLSPKNKAVQKREVGGGREEAAFA